MTFKGMMELGKFLSLWQSQVAQSNLSLSIFLTEMSCACTTFTANTFSIVEQDLTLRSPGVFWCNSSSAHHQKYLPYCLFIVLDYSKIRQIDQQNFLLILGK